MRISEVTLVDLPNKHYCTTVTVRVDERTFHIHIAGEGSIPSIREIEAGWEEDCGMDHVESLEHEYLANLVLEALKNKET